MSTEDTSPVGIMGKRVRTMRKERGFTAEQLAAEVTRLGVKWDRSAVAKLESGRRATVTIADVYVFALALNCAPLTLLVPESDGDEVLVAPGNTAEDAVIATGKDLGMWIAGDKQLAPARGVPGWFKFVGALPEWKVTDAANSLARVRNALGAADERLFREMVENQPNEVQRQLLSLIRAAEEPKES
ncbi:helix-turn-helix domain-containing protein [Amycolatopsis sp. GM8]|uniref:helix-turn-helix domain-containing protein n=1 Tax=Amycolatopsis sp. GM8 TaxID=2896530 RepID=UPI001F3D32C5|nr:helix-turn-helix transcriptional regulator [Amycolatopsis sp. GM8]